MFTFWHSSDNRFIQMSVYRKSFNWSASAIPNFRLRVMYLLKELQQRSRHPCCFHITMCCISMNNRCVEHVLEDNKWTVLVLIVSDDICILGNSPGNTSTTTPWTPFISHETLWKVLRHLKWEKLDYSEDKMIICCQWWWNLQRKSIFYHIEAGKS